MKIWLTTKCNVTEEVVEKNDEEHLNLWKNMYFGFKGNCTGNSKESLKHCNSTDEMLNVDGMPMYKSALNIILQLTIIICFVYVSVFMLLCLNYKYKLFQNYSYNSYII